MSQPCHCVQSVGRLDMHANVKHNRRGRMCTLHQPVMLTLPAQTSGHAPHLPAVLCHAHRRIQSPKICPSHPSTLLCSLRPATRATVSLPSPAIGYSPAPSPPQENSAAAARKRPSHLWTGLPLPASAHIRPPCFGREAADAAEGSQVLQSWPRWAQPCPAPPTDGISY